MKKSILNSFRYVDDLPVAPLITYYVYKMLFVIEGRIRLSFNNRAYIVGPHSLVCISNFEEHSIEILNRPYRRYYLSMIPNQLDLLVKDPRILVLFKKPSTCKNIFDVYSLLPDLLTIFENLGAEYGQRDRFSERLIHDLLYRLTVLIYRSFQTRFPQVETRINMLVYEIQHYIDQHFHEPLQINRVAKQFFISPSYLTHKFKEFTGYSPMEYLKLNRLSFSRLLLNSTDYSISEIAVRSGFSDTNNYIKAFKAYYHLTPRQARKKMHINASSSKWVGSDYPPT